MLINSCGSKRHRKIVARRAKFGKSETHELLIFKSNMHIYAAIFSFCDKRSVFSVSSLSLKVNGKSISRKVAAAEIGKTVAKRCLLCNINPVVNIAEYSFHGIVKVLIESFRGAMNE